MMVHMSWSSYLTNLHRLELRGQTGGSKVLTDLVEELQEPAVELRLKIDQNHADLKGGYVVLHVPFTTYASRILKVFSWLVGVHKSFRDYGEAVLNHLEKKTLKKVPVNYEGVRVSGHGGWFLMRLSLHDPVLPLNIEAPSNEDAVKLGLTVLSAANEFSALDVSALAKFVQQ